MRKLLADKIVVITGAAGTIGFASAIACLEEGASVVLADRDLPLLKSREKEISNLSFTGANFQALDLRSDSSIAAFVKEVLNQHGRIDSIICNAATFFFEPLEKWQNMDGLDLHYQVGLRGHTALIQEAWKRSPESKSGSVITISSIAGHVGEPNAFAYTPIKAALKGLMLSCAIDMASSGGWAVTLSPGHTWSTPHQQRASAEGLTREQYEDSKPNIQSTMFGKFLEPQDVGRWVALLASPYGKALTGQDLHLTYGIEAGGFNKGYKTTV